MLINTDFIAPAELTGFARAALADLADNQFRLSQFLPDLDVNDLDYRFYRGGEGLIEAATYRSYDTESPVGARPGISRVQGELPPISRKIRLGEYDRLRQRQAPENAIVNALQGDAERMTRSVAGRIELARAEALVSSKVTLAENGVYATVDFGRKSEHTVTAATVWTDAAAKPLTDLLAWQDVYVATNGEQPGRILTSTRTFSLLLRNAEFRGLAANVVAGTPGIVSATQVNSTLSAYGLPQFVLNDQQIRVNGTAQRLVPMGKLTFLPADSADLGRTLWGTTAESLEPEYGIDGGEAPGIVAGAYSTFDPVAVWTKAAAIALPIVVNPDLTLTATVHA